MNGDLLALGAVSLLAAGGLAARRGSRGLGREPDAAEKIERMRRAVKAIHDRSPDFFEGSCAYVSLLLFHSAKRLGWTGVRIWAGGADPPVWTEAPGCDHVWLIVDGRIYDPTWSWYEVAEGASYEGEDTSEDLADLEWFGGVEETENMEEWDQDTDFIMPILRGES